MRFRRRLAQEFAPSDFAGASHEMLGYFAWQSRCGRRQGYLKHRPASLIPNVRNGFKCCSTWPTTRSAKFQLFAPGRRPAPKSKHSTAPITSGWSRRLRQHNRIRARRRYDHLPRFFRRRFAGGGRFFRLLDAIAAKESQRLCPGPPAGPSRLARSRDGLLLVQHHRDRRANI